MLVALTLLGRAHSAPIVHSWTRAAILRFPARPEGIPIQLDLGFA